jgi:hypothetical protein
MQGLPRQVRIVEVGPRDGLQNEGAPLDIAQRLALIARLADAGLTTIESGAFVSPRKVPNMAGSGDLMQRLERRPGVSYPFLVPNATGLDAALDAGCEDIALFAAASETFSQRNTACSISESMTRLAAAAERALAAGLRVRGYLSCVMGCPYEGSVAPSAVAAMAADLLGMGCYEVSLGDTTGVGSPHRVRRLIETRCTPDTRRAARRTFSRHLGHGRGERLCRAAVWRDGVRCIGGRSGWLSVRTGRKRKRCDGRRCLHASRRWCRYRYRPLEAGRCGALGQRTAGKTACLARGARLQHDT